eukprot:882245-Karenia_brevis.AAC.1
MPEEMLDPYRQHQTMKVPLTPELLKFQKMLLSRRQRIDGRCDFAVIIACTDKTYAMTRIVWTIVCNAILHAANVEHACGYRQWQIQGSGVG